MEQKKRSKIRIRMKWKGLMNICSVRENSVAKVPQPLSASNKRLRNPSSSFQRLLSSESNGISSPGSRDAEDLSGPDLLVFTMNEIRHMTKSFRHDHMLGEGGFGTVHKGYLDDSILPGGKITPVAVKVLNLEGLQGHREWLTEVKFLGQLRHTHLVKLLGYCCEDEERVLVYEYMPRGSLENQLFKRISVSLPWPARMKIAYGAAKGLAFLHGAEKPVIYRDFKTSNILLDSDYTAKLSDFGLAKDGPLGDDTHVSTRVMGTYGYAAPEYVMTGHLTARSDVYSFGVVLLELLTGRRSLDRSRPTREQSLADWARPYLNDKRKLLRIIDPRLEGQFSVKAAQKAANLAYNCLNQNPKARPLMKDVVEILEPLQYMKDMAYGFSTGATTMVTTLEFKNHCPERSKFVSRCKLRSDMPSAKISYRSTKSLAREEISLKRGDGHSEALS